MEMKKLGRVLCNRLLPFAELVWSIGVTVWVRGAPFMVDEIATVVDPTGKVSAVYKCFEMSGTPLTRQECL